MKDYDRHEFYKRVCERDVKKVDVRDGEK